jgi:hypothetical protein
MKGGTVVLGDEEPAPCPTKQLHYSSSFRSVTGIRPNQLFHELSGLVGSAQQSFPNTFCKDVFTTIVK